MKKIPIRYIHASSEDHYFAGNFSIRDVKELLAGQDLVQDIHRHDFFFILALQKGKGDHEIDFTPHKVKDHSIFFMRPGQVHQLTLKAGCTGFIMQFRKDFYYPNEKESRLLLRRVSNKNLCQLDAEKFKKLFSILSYIFREYTDKKESYAEVIKANLGIFFIELMRHRMDEKNSPDSNSLFTQDRLDRFLELVENHISKHKQVSHYAGMLNLSVYQLNSIAKSTLGKTCSELIDEQIILESKRFLLVTTNQVKEIAYNLGYEDVSYFIRFFKKHTGHTPEAFRANFR